MPSGDSAPSGVATGVGERGGGLRKKKTINSRSKDPQDPAHALQPPAAPSTLPSLSLHAHSPLLGPSLDLQDLPGWFDGLFRHLRGLEMGEEWRGAVEEWARVERGYGWVNPVSL